MSLGNIIIILLAVSGLAVAVAAVFSWIFAQQWCRPKRTIRLETLGDYGLFFENVGFMSKGVRLSGCFAPAYSRNPRRPTIILVHGWSNDSVDMLPLAYRLIQEDFSVFLFDVRGHGVSGQDGNVTLLTFAQDIRAAVDYLQTRDDVDMNSLGLIGHSVGGSGAIVAASEDERIRAVVAASAFADPEALLRDFMVRSHIPSWPFPWLVRRFIEHRLGRSFESIAPRNRIGRITVPLMLIHGESDNFIPQSNLEILYGRANRVSTQRLIIGDRGHSDVVLDPGCFQSVVEFLHDSLLPEDDRRQAGSPIDSYLVKDESQIAAVSNRCENRRAAL